MVRVTFRRKDSEICPQEAQKGFALPTVLFALLGMMAILSIGALAALNTQRSTVRDANSKSALAIAEAGANTALLRYNRYETTANAPCLVEDPEHPGEFKASVLPLRAMGSPLQGWCDPIPGKVGDPGSESEGEFVYWVKPMVGQNQEETQLEIVSEGRLTSPSEGSPDDTTRRVMYLAGASGSGDDDDDENGSGGSGDPGDSDDPGSGDSSTGPGGGDDDPGSGDETDPGNPPPGAFIGTENIVGIDWLAIDGNSPIYSNAGSNGQVYIKDSARICGDVRMGPGTEPPVGPHLAHWMQPPEANYSNGQGGGICYTPGQPEHSLGYGTRDFPPVKLPEGLTPATSATNRFFTEDGNDLPDWYIGTEQLRRQRWNPETRTLTIDAGLTLRLKATYPYLLCRLVLAGGATIIADAPGQPVQIFFDKPENCPDLPNTNQYRAWYLPQPHWQPGSKQQLEIANGTKFLSNGYVPGLFFLGSDTIPTAAVMAGGSETHQMVVYAPKTEIDISGDFKFRGAMIGKTLHMGGGSRINAPFDGTTYPIPVDPPAPDLGDDGDDDDTGVPDPGSGEDPPPGGGTGDPNDPNNPHNPNDPNVPNDPNPNPNPPGQLIFKPKRFTECSAISVRYNPMAPDSAC